jgi:hypothetical protein
MLWPGEPDLGRPGAGLMAALNALMS